jgi:two-component system, NarL family, nitrate/nitrite response regulator NarL
MVSQSQSTSTVIIGHSALLREGVAALLQHTRYKVIASAQRASELKDLQLLSDGRRRMLVILGIDDASGNIAETAENIRLLRSHFFDSRIVVVAEVRGPIDIQQILTLAPDGYIANLCSRDILVKLLELALLDQQVTVLSRPTPSPRADDQTVSAKQVGLATIAAPSNVQSSSAMAISTNDPQLSQRERQVLFHLAAGESNKEIARLCNIAESTVKVHLKAILRKITVHNRTQAAIWAIANGYHILPQSSDRLSNHSIDQMYEVR